MHQGRTALNPESTLTRNVRVPQPRKILIPLAAIACLVGLGGCFLLQTHPMDNSQINAYASETGKSAASATSESTELGIERWKSLVGDFSVSNLKGNVASVYAEQTFFNDTLKTFRDPRAIEDYLIETAEMLKYGRVDYQDTAISGNDVYVRWKMTYRSKKLAKDDDIVTIGMSHLRFDEAGKVILHQDFWDSTRGVFEHVPVIGSGIRMIKKRL
ncbi:MAG: hypothetical protein ACI8XO_001598 [Verrucomicrobiales bacterium]